MINFFKRLMIPHLSTERLELRMIQVSDYKAVYDAFKDEAYLRYFGIPSVSSEQDAKRLITDWVKRLDPQTFVRWAIILKENGQVIGTIGLHTFVNQYKKAAVGYDLRPEYQHQGFVSEALQMIMRYFFEDLGYHRLEATIALQNTPSIAVAERAGFKREGLMRQWMYNCVYEEFYDAYIYAILDTDYLEDQ